MQVLSLGTIGVQNAIESCRWSSIFYLPAVLNQVAQKNEKILTVKTVYWLGMATKRGRGRGGHNTPTTPTPSGVVIHCRISLSLSRACRACSRCPGSHAVALTLPSLLSAFCSHTSSLRPLIEPSFFCCHARASQSTSNLPPSLPPPPPAVFQASLAP